MIFMSFNVFLFIFQLNTGSREVIDLNIGPIGERINSAGSDLSLGSGSRSNSASSVSSSDGSRVNSLERRKRNMSTSRREVPTPRSNRFSSQSRENSTEKRVSSAGSDSDSSMSSTLKGLDTPRSMNSTLKANAPQTLNIDLSVANIDHDDSITYEQLQSMIETVLVECGYYSPSQSQLRQRTPPLANLDSVRNRLLNSPHLTDMIQ